MEINPCQVETRKKLPFNQKLDFFECGLAFLTVL
jgi:hypothetical protein